MPPAGALTVSAIALCVIALILLVGLVAFLVGARQIITEMRQLRAAVLPAAEQWREAGARVSEVAERTEQLLSGAQTAATVAGAAIGAGRALSQGVRMVQHLWGETRPPESGGLGSQLVVGALRMGIAALGRRRARQRHKTKSTEPTHPLGEVGQPRRMPG